jgi:hypothetical protein
LHSHSPAQCSTAHFGRRIRAPSVVSVVFDARARTISFVVDDGAPVLAYTNLPTEDLYPAVRFHDTGTNCLTFV